MTADVAGVARYRPRACEQCGVEYGPRSHEQKYCSADCREAARAERTLLPCGTLASYRRGCHCEDCRAANARHMQQHRERRYGQTPPDYVKHGRSTYTNWGCRCDICTADWNEMLKGQRTRRVQVAATTPEVVPHGINGYTGWECRCDICHEAAGPRFAAGGERQKVRNNESRDKATRHYYEWTSSELELADSEDLTEPEVAAMIGRTIKAVHNIRYKLRNGTKARPVASQEET